MIGKKLSKSELKIIQSQLKPIEPKIEKIKKYKPIKIKQRDDPIINLPKLVFNEDPLEVRLEKRLEQCFEHCKKRLYERFKIELDKEKWLEVNNKIYDENGFELLAKAGDNRYIYFGRPFKTSMAFIFDTLFGCTITILPQDNLLIARYLTPKEKKKVQEEHERKASIEEAVKKNAIFNRIPPPPIKLQIKRIIGPE